jgi:diguanylate cyclase (GGDEF)-like protein/PAS domain S-box-containing protein
MVEEDSAIRGLTSELRAAQERIQALEAQLAQQVELTHKLREHSSFREAVIEQASEGVCVCHDIPRHPFVEFTVWNNEMARITGYSLEEINRLGWYQTMYPDPAVRELARKRMDRMRKGDDLRHEHWVITRADGKQRLVSISTSILTASDSSVHVLALMSDLTDRDRWRAEARIDDLTGVRNRRGFHEDAALLLRLAVRQNQPITMAYIDVDNLKAVNDRLGHPEGDRVLEAVGTALLEAVRDTDVVGRLGGDEFALALLGMDAKDAREYSSRLHQRLLEMMQKSGWATGVSIGVATFSGSIPDLDTAVASADSLMYKAKAEGKSELICEELAG